MEDHHVKRTRKAGIVGCGAIAQVHAEAISEMRDVELVAGADIKLDRAERLMERYGGKAYQSLEEMLAHEQLDVLHICTPHALHTAMAATAAENGIAVFTEKPPVTSIEQWKTLCSTAEQTPIGICFQNRYNQSVQYIKRLLESGKPGDFLGARAVLSWSRDLAYYKDSGWRGEWATEGGGVLINQAIHTLDLLVYFLGRATSVDARMQNFHLKGQIEVEDTLEARINMGGVSALFYATTAYCTNAPVLFELVCANATIRMEELKVVVLWNDGREETAAFQMKQVAGKVYWGSGHLVCIRDFYDHLDKQEAPPIGVREVRDTVELLLATYESAQRETEISL